MARQINEGKKVYDKMPKGWKIEHGAMTAPLGAVVINNGGSLFPKDGQKRRETALLITDKELYEEGIKRHEQKQQARSSTSAQRAQQTTTAKNNSAIANTSKPAQGKSATSYSVRCGRTSKTFATKQEAKEYASTQSKGKTVNITESTKKPTHKIVKFTAKK